MANKPQLGGLRLKVKIIRSAGNGWVRWFGVRRVIKAEGASRGDEFALHFRVGFAPCKRTPGNEQVTWVSCCHLAHTSRRRGQQHSTGEPLQVWIERWKKSAPDSSPRDTFGSQQSFRKSSDHSSDRKQIRIQEQPERAIRWEIVFSVSNGRDFWTWHRQCPQNVCAETNSNTSPAERPILDRLYRALRSRRGSAAG